jgi:endonuclease YncB( thermonuclease family)
MSSSLKPILEESLNSKKGITFFIRGNTVAGYVTKINEDTVEVKNRNSSKVLIRLDSIDAVELS